MAPDGFTTEESAENCIMAVLNTSSSLVSSVERGAVDFVINFLLVFLLTDEEREEDLEDDREEDRDEERLGLGEREAAGEDDADDGVAGERRPFLNTFFWAETSSSSSRTRRSTPLSNIAKVDGTLS